MTNRDNLQRIEVTTMKRNTWIGFAGSLSAWFVMSVVGCGPTSSGNTDERLGESIEAFAIYSPNACTSGCDNNAPDGICSASETAFTCGPDCSCGDGYCDAAGEDTTSCPIDCKFGSDSQSDLDDFCGNNRCDPWEIVPGGFLCAQDCDHTNPDPIGTTCGDSICELGENSAGCPGDCGNPALCGNGTCDEAQAETNATCPVDCPSPYLKHGRFLGTACVGYALYAKYSDGSGSYTQHLVSNLAAGCGAYPWKLHHNNGQCNGSQLLKPDGSICEITGASCTTSIYNWAVLGTPYVMAAQDPNKCNSYTITAAGFAPIEWNKHDQVTCSPQSPCQRYQCGGQSNTLQDGSVQWRWVPKVAPWSFYAPYCTIPL